MERLPFLVSVFIERSIRLILCRGQFALRRPVTRLESKHSRSLFGRHGPLGDPPLASGLAARKVRSVLHDLLREIRRNDNSILAEETTSSPRVPLTTDRGRQTGQRSTSFPVTLAKNSSDTSHRMIPRAKLSRTRVSPSRTRRWQNRCAFRADVVEPLFPLLFFPPRR